MNTVFDKLIDLKKQRLGLDKKPVTPKKEEEAHIRTVGNIDTIVESQRIFNPNLPPTNPNIPSGASPSIPATKAPPARMTGTGTAGSVDLQGRWGTPEEGK